MQTRVMHELSYEGFSKEERPLTCLFTSVDETLKQFGDDVWGLAEDTCCLLIQKDIAASIIAFKALGNCFMNPLWLYDEYTDKAAEVLYHPVVLTGDCIVDFKCCKSLMYLPEYIARMRKYNPKGIRLDKVLSSAFHPSDGMPFVPTVEYLEKEYLADLAKAYK